MYSKANNQSNMLNRKFSELEENFKKEIINYAKSFANLDGYKINLEKSEYIINPKLSVISIIENIETPHIMHVLDCNKKEGCMVNAFDGDENLYGRNSIKYEISKLNLYRVDELVSANDSVLKEYSYYDTLLSGLNWVKSFCGYGEKS